MSETSPAPDPGPTPEPTPGPTPERAPDLESGPAPLPGWWATTASALDATMGLEVTELTPARVVGSMPVQGNTQPYGLWHGGASCVLAETLASIGSSAHARTLDPDAVAVGVDLNATHHRPVRGGRVTGTATALRLGRRVTSYEVVLTDGEGLRVGTARVTCQVVPAPRTPPSGATPPSGGAPPSGAAPAAGA